MNNENPEQILEKYKKSITENLQTILNDYKMNEIIPNTLNELNYFLTVLKNKKIKTDFINNQITNDHLFVFLFLLQEEGTRTLGLKILRNNIEIHPPFAKRLVNKMFPMLICKILEDFKSKNFNEAKIAIMIPYFKVIKFQIFFIYYIIFRAIIIKFIQEFCFIKI